jgi:hypothetical protein
MPRANTQPAAAEAQSDMQAAAQATTRVPPTRRPAREVSTDDVREPALDAIAMPELGKGLPDRGDTQVALPEGHISNDYLEALAFNEEPVRIRIEAGSDENPQMTVDCWCNGKGAEIFNPTTKRWLETNCLPVGLVIITKRKYVEILARSKSMRVRTPDHGDGKNIDNNTVTRHHSRAHVFSVIGDSERGVEWLTQILNEAF